LGVGRGARQRVQDGLEGQRARRGRLGQLADRGAQLAQARDQAAQEARQAAQRVDELEPQRLGQRVSAVERFEERPPEIGGAPGEGDGVELRVHGV
jgi:hypothetical protein